MSEKSGLPAKNATPKPTVTLSQPGILQRTCDCGGVPGLTGQCEECNSKRFSGQRRITPPALPNNPPDDQAASQTQHSPLVGYSFENLAIEPKERFGIQTKLAIGQPGDKYEQEANRVAHQVIQMPEPKIQRLYPESPEELRLQLMAEAEKETLQTKPLVESVTPQEQKQPQAAAQQTIVSANLQKQITALQGGGRPLPQAERAFFEPRFGADFSQVRIHADTLAASAASAINARAFTLGRDIVFGAGQYQPQTTEGQRLLAHELTHTIQQKAGKILPAPRRLIDSEKPAEPQTPAAANAVLLSQKPFTPIVSETPYIAREEPPSSSSSEREKFGIWPPEPKVEIFEIIGTEGQSQILIDSMPAVELKYEISQPKPSFLVQASRSQNGRIQINLLVLSPGITQIRNLHPFRVNSDDLRPVVDLAIQGWQPQSITRSTTPKPKAPSEPAKSTKGRSRAPFAKVLELNERVAMSLSNCVTALKTLPNPSKPLQDRIDAIEQLSQRAADQKTGGEQVVDAWVAGEEIPINTQVDAANFVLNDRPNTKGLAYLERLDADTLALIDLVLPRVTALSKIVESLGADMPIEMRQAFHTVAGYYLDTILKASQPESFDRIKFLDTFYHDPRLIQSYGLWAYIRAQLPDLYNNLLQANKAGVYTFSLPSELKSGDSRFSPEEIRNLFQQGLQGQRAGEIARTTNAIRDLKGGEEAIGVLPSRLEEVGKSFNPDSNAALMRLFADIQVRVAILRLWQPIEPLQSLLYSTNNAGQSLLPFVKQDRQRWLDELRALEVEFAAELKQGDHPDIDTKVDTWQKRLQRLLDDIPPEVRQKKIIAAIVEQIPFMFVSGGTAVRMGSWVRAARQSRLLVALAEGTTMTLFTAAGTPLNAPNRPQSALGWAANLSVNVALALVGRAFFDVGDAAARVAFSRSLVASFGTRIVVPTVTFTTLQTGVQILESKIKSTGGETNFTELLTLNLVLNGIGMAVGAVTAIPETSTAGIAPTKGTGTIVKPSVSDIAKRFNIPEDQARLLFEVADRLNDYQSAVAALKQAAAKGSFTKPQFEALKKQALELADFLEARLEPLAKTGAFGSATPAEVKAYLALVRTRIGTMRWEAQGKVTALLPEATKGLVRVGEGPQWVYDRRRPPQRLSALRADYEKRGNTVKALPSGGWEASDSKGNLIIQVIPVSEQAAQSLAPKQPEPVAKLPSAIDQAGERLESAGTAKKVADQLYAEEEQKLIKANEALEQAEKDLTTAKQSQNQQEIEIAQNTYNTALKRRNSTRNDLKAAKELQDQAKIDELRAATKLSQLRQKTLAQEVDKLQSLIYQQLRQKSHAETQARIHQDKATSLRVQGQETLESARQKIAGRLRIDLRKATQAQREEIDAEISRSKIGRELEDIFKKIQSELTQSQKNLNLKNKIEEQISSLRRDFANKSNELRKEIANQPIELLERKPADIKVNPVAPKSNNGKGTIGRTPNQNLQLQADLTDARNQGARDIRVNQEQVNPLGERVGINQPDLQYTIGNQRYYIEYEQMNNPRGMEHARRILANDPSGIVIIKLIPTESGFKPGEGIVEIRFP